MAEAGRLDIIHADMLPDLIRNSTHRNIYFESIHSVCQAYQFLLKSRSSRTDSGARTEVAGGSLKLLSLRLALRPGLPPKTFRQENREL